VFIVVLAWQLEAAVLFRAPTTACVVPSLEYAQPPLLGVLGHVKKRPIVASVPP
jgi:hypothetical protein